MTQQEFISRVGLKATADMLKTGVLASVTVAQAILESGYGTTILATRANNLFGMKCSLSGNTWPGSTWDGRRRCTKETGEEYNGQNVTITADFRYYDSWDDSIADHSAYLIGAKNGSELRYAGLQGERDYRRAIAIIKVGGYATDSLYVSKVCSIIEKWDLTRFDGEEIDMNINKMITKKKCYIGTNKPAYVVIHETDNWSKGAGAKTHATAMYNGNLDGTVHYYVDSGAIYQTLDHSDGAWAVGDGKGRYGITNNNSINIEICVNPESAYYTAVDKAEQLAAYLLKQYGWGTDRLKRHYDASRKHCPRRILDEGLWTEFVQKTAAYMGGAVVSKEWLELGDSGADVKTLQSNLIKLGYSCGDTGADGVFGEDTDAAVRKFQAAHKLSVDGQAGKATQAKIKELLSPKVESDAIKYYVQAGAFKNKSKAQELVDKLKAAGFDAIIKGA